MDHWSDCTIANNAKETPVEIAKAMRRTHAVKEMADYGQEPFPILCVNEVRRRSSSQTDNKPLVLFDKVDGTLPPSDFVYIKSCVEVKGLHIDRSMESMEGCNCGQLCIERGCNCARSSKRRRLWFDSEGKINADIKKFKNPIVFECNLKCSCSSQCPNRVVQKGLKYRLELFRTLSKGWGVRAKENIPMGSMICEYAGQLITDEAANLMKDDTYICLTSMSMVKWTAVCASMLVSTAMSVALLITPVSQMSFLCASSLSTMIGNSRK
ncbi:histone-lysine N-methyltransferase EHMT2-like [Oscarella lobularis]|uniref:histone-lysine N-methyltransferase EHMT2-like n=1 Tax=Oscarella lobularis TaxID=121494 RepID=UPI0033133F54